MKWLLCLCLVVPSVARADDDPYLLPHPDARWWLSGQLNVIAQAHDRFTSPYEGEHSLHHGREGKMSEVATIYGGIAVTETTEVLSASHNRRQRILAHASWTKARKLVALRS